MSITVRLGKAGRLMIPKSIRESLGLRKGALLRIESSDGKIEAIPEADRVRIEMQDGFPVIRGGRPRRKADIVNAIKATRDEREQRILARNPEQ